MAVDNADVVKHGNVYEAMDALASEVLFIKNDAVNPHFKNRYASLKGVFTQLRQPMRKHGLTYHQKLTDIDGQIALKTMIKHPASETSDTSTAPLSHKPNDPQGVGSAITYFRRYALLTQLGLLTDDDDDGNLAAGREELKTPAETAQKFWIAKSDLTKELLKSGMTVDQQKALVSKTLNKEKIETVEEVNVVRKAAGLK